jgi:NACalpha-BTF3-like transcription factor
MAYKNKKKNKARQAEIRKANSHKKHQREYRRNHKDDKPLTQQDLEIIMKQQGLI